MPVILSAKARKLWLETVSRNWTDHATGGNAGEQGGHRGTGMRCADPRV